MTKEKYNLQDDADITPKQEFDYAKWEDIIEIDSRLHIIACLEFKVWLELTQRKHQFNIAVHKKYENTLELISGYIKQEMETYERRFTCWPKPSI